MDRAYATECVSDETSATSKGAVRQPLGGGLGGISDPSRYLRIPPGTGI
jgi:hypothetical protein